MDWDTIRLNWERVGKLAQARWPWLTDEQVASVGGDRKRLDAVIASESKITLQEAAHQSQEFGLKVEAVPGDKIPPAPAPAKPAAPAGASGASAVGGAHP